MSTRKLSRRDFLRIAAVTAGGALAAACAPAVPPATPVAAPKTEPPKQAAPTEAPKTAPQPASAGKMVFWPEWGGKDADALQAQVNKFTKETGTEVEFLPIRDHARMIASISAGNPPDLLMTWDAGAVGSWGFEGALRDLKSYIDVAKMDLKSFIPIGLASGNLMGAKQIGIPLTNYITTVLYWNKQTFKSAGLDPEKGPTTWDETWQMAEKITKVESGQIKKWGYGVLMGQDGHPTTMAYANGGSIWSKDNRQVTPDDPANIEGLRWMRKFYEKYKTEEVRRWISSATMGADSPTNPLYTGDLGMWLTGEWMPSYVERLKDIKVDLGAAYLPYAKAEGKGTMCANTNPLVIPTAAKNADAAFKFIQFISQPANSGEMCVIVGNAAPTYEGVKVQAANTKNTMYKWLLEEVWLKGNIKPMTINSPVGNQYRDAYNRARAEVVEDGKDPVKAMKEVKDEIQPQLDAALKKLGL
jgi:ABC-type glycerol-3-phosphate transport system substrate-binding protein